MVTVMIQETPVFDRGNIPTSIVDSQTEWQPARVRMAAPGVSLRLDNDGPQIEWRRAAQEARLSSNAYSGQASNDNEAWPLQKLLRTEGNDHCLALAERYRAVHELATVVVHLVGQDPSDLYVLHEQDDEGRTKGVKKVKGKKADIVTFPRTPSGPIARAWNGDWRMLASIDAKRELAFLRGKLAYVPKILDGFEWAVVDSMTLEEIGKRLGAGSKGAKGEARARIFDGFGIVDRFWQEARAA